MDSLRKSSPDRSPEFPRNPPQRLGRSDGGPPITRLRAAFEVLDAAEDAGAEIRVKPQSFGTEFRYPQV